MLVGSNIDNVLSSHPSASILDIYLVLRVLRHLKGKQMYHGICFCRLFIVYAAVDYHGSSFRKHGEKKPRKAGGKMIIIIGYDNDLQHGSSLDVCVGLVPYSSLIYEALKVSKGVHITLVFNNQCTSLMC